MSASFNTSSHFGCVAPPSGGLAIVSTSGFKTQFFNALIGTLAEGHLVGDTNLAVLPAFSPNEVRLHDIVKDEPLVALEFPAEVLRVVVNAALYVAFRQRCWMGRCTVSWPLRSFCALTGDNKVYVVDISNMKVVHSFDVCPHPSRLLALAYNPQRSFLAFPNSSAVGEVTVYDVAKQSAVNIVKAHVGSLSALAVSPTGTMLATASDSGTLFADFGTGPEEVLLVGSNSGTVHGFAIEGPFLEKYKRREVSLYSSSGGHSHASSDSAPDDSIMSTLSSVVASVASAGAATVEGTRSVLRIQLPQSGSVATREVLAFAVHALEASGTVVTCILSSGAALQYLVPPALESSQVKLIGDFSLEGVVPDSSPEPQAGVAEAADAPAQDAADE